MMMFLCLISVIAFAQSSENNYIVTITYTGEDGKILTEKINVLSTSASEAEAKATKQWEALKQANWEFKFANAERMDEPQVAAPQKIGYLKVTNAHPWPTNIHQTKMWIDGISIKPSSASAYES
jgi:hypothetical protein